MNDLSMPAEESNMVAIQQLAIEQLLVRFFELSTSATYEKDHKTQQSFNRGGEGLPSRLDLAE